MSINVTVTLDLSESFKGLLQMFMQGFSQSNQQAPIEKTEGEKEEIQDQKVTAGPPKQSTKTKDTSISGDKQKEDKTEDTDTEDTLVEFTDLRSAFAERLKAGKTAELQSILSKFKVTKLSEVPPEKYAEAYKLVLGV